MSGNGDAPNVQRQLSEPSRRPPPHPRIPPSISIDHHEDHGLFRRKKSTTKPALLISYSLPCDYSADEKRRSVPPSLSLPSSPLPDDRVKSLERVQPGRERSRKLSGRLSKSSKVRSSSAESVKRVGLIGGATQNLRQWMRCKSVNELDGKGQ